MKLLFDQHLSPRLVERLADLYPNSIHIETIGLGKADDKKIWDHAWQGQYLIVTKDADFSDLGTILGFPPQIIWIRRGNCSTKTIENILRQYFDLIKAFVQDQNIGVLTLF
ncbi:DUF5615 family PIN-like protein [candidate division KSB1 bacterium]|nr:DUF5615 family PIN-like protein [candidate division KSB1 bacterium]